MRRKNKEKKKKIKRRKRINRRKRDARGSEGKGHVIGKVMSSRV